MSAAELKELAVFYSDKEKEHQPALEVFEGGVVQKPFEISERCDIIMQALRTDAAARFRAAVAEPADHGREALLLAHSDDYLAFLEHAWSEWAQRGGGQGRDKKMSPVLLASTFVPRRAPAVDEQQARARLARSIVSAKMGYYSFDTGCPLVAGTWPAAYWAAQCALSAAERVQQQRGGVALAVCRPPGHHAGRDFMGGYCYVNNAAVAAARLASGGARVAVLDVDYHAGNGTQDIFYASPDVLTVSIHCDPADEYPYHIGFADETGHGAGAGHHLNIPLPPGTADPEYLAAAAVALQRIRDHAPAYLVVSFGVDTSINDPLGSFKVTDQAYTSIAASLAQLQLPTAVILEGGYASAALGASVVAFMNGFFA